MENASTPLSPAAVRRPYEFASPTLDTLHSLSKRALFLEELLQRNGVKVTLSKNSFQNLLLNNPDRVAKTVENLESRIEIIQSALEQDISLTDNKGLFWYACRRFNLRPDSETLDRIRDDDVLEIYNMDVVQIFSNFKFWNLCSYPIDQILSEEFYTLFDRPEAINQSIMVTLQKVLQTRKLVEHLTPSHEVRERNSTKKYTFRVQNRFLSPLFDRHDGSIAAILSTLSAERIGP